MRHAPWILLAAALAVAAWFLVRTPSSTAGDDLAAESAASSGETVASTNPLDAGPAAQRTAEPLPNPVAPPAVVVVDAEDLLARLRAIARAFDVGDAKRIEAEMQPVVGAPVRVLWVLDWLTTPAALEDGTAVLGATLVLEAAVAVYDRTGASFGLSGQELVLRMLDGLPKLDVRLRKRLVDVLADARNDRGWVLDTRFLARVVELRRAHPDQASDYSPLLARIAESLAEGDRRGAFRRLFLDGEEDPLLVKVALCSLLESAPEVFLPLAEELFQRDPNNAKLRSAIAQAIASAAPVDLAARSLGRISDSYQYGALMTLGSRTGAHDAVAREYDALLASGGNPIGRKMLVSALQGEPAEILLGIGRLDPDRGVRLQAFLTLTSSGPVDRSVVDELRTLRGEPGPGNANLGVSSVSIVAGNIIRSSTGAARDAARDLLSEMVRDTSLSDKDRLEAYGRVKKWVPNDAFFGVLIGGKPLQ